MPVPVPARLAHPTTTFTQGPHSGLPESAEAPASVPRWRDAEPLLRDLRGVRAVRIELDAAGGLAAVHVMTTADIAPKQAVRDVQTALAAHFDVAVDHRKISIAATGHGAPLGVTSGAVRPGYGESRHYTPPNGAPIAGGAPAPAVFAAHLDAVEVSRSGATVRCRVTLRAADGTAVDGNATAECDSADGEAAQLVAGARAALAALASLERPGVAVALADCVAVDAFGRRFALASITTRAGREAASLVGVGELSAAGDGAAAGAGAALDAVLPWLTAGARLR